MPKASGDWICGQVVNMALHTTGHPIYIYIYMPISLISNYFFAGRRSFGSDVVVFICSTFVSLPPLYSILYLPSLGQYKHSLHRYDRYKV